MALKLGQAAPWKSSSRVGGSDERYRCANVLRWNFPARGDMPPVKVHWYDGYRGDPNAKDDAGNPTGPQNRANAVSARRRKRDGRNLRMAARSRG